ncbi:unnamed protein product [Effrenium voratum]|uniref:PRA1 family protein n=1 Tax=Effrenium voratum TaxID=2562239 RepID=A0AA36MK11_9DINO|nr:unnamed protein product [Effrenium voratum]
MGDDDLISALAADASVSVAAPAPAPAPAPGPAGVPKEVVMGYHRLFAHDYFERQLPRFTSSRPESPEVAEAWKAAVCDSWLCRLPSFASGAGEEAWEASCAELLQLTVQGSVWGIKARPWRDFAGPMQFPDHPWQRLPCNLQRYAGNYLNLLLALAMAGAAQSRPLLFGACAMAKAVALLAPPEMFDVELLTSGSFRSVGGGWLRLLLAALGEFGLAASCFCRSGARGGLLGGGLVLAHALLRTRPWTDMAKDKVKSAKEQVTRLKSQ